jgi:F0F1-type ATP synthase membrane subunit b/b'
MSFLDRAKERAEELAKKAKPMAETAREKAKPMAEKAKEQAGRVAEKAKDSASSFRQGLHNDNEPSKPKPAEDPGTSGPPAG